jgi:2-iminobutanoate/2-iminopropanoate deaminase
MRSIKTANAPKAIGPYSQAVVSNKTVYISGQIPLDPLDGQIIGSDVHEQTEQVIANIQAILSAAGTDISSVIKTTCYLRSMSDFAAFNEVYSKYFTSKPARACVAVVDLPRGAQVEIEVVAEIGSD